MAKEFWCLCKLMYEEGKNETNYATIPEKWFIDYLVMEIALDTPWLNSLGSCWNELALNLNKACPTRLPSSTVDKFTKTP